MDTFSVDVYVKDSICFDIEVGTNDPLDSLYLKLTSSTFDLFGSYMQPVAYVSGNTIMFMTIGIIMLEIPSFSISI